MIGSTIAGIFNPKDTSKLRSQHFWTVFIDFKDFCNIINPHIILVQLFELLSAGKNKTGKICFCSFCLSGQKPLCEMGILKFCQNHESFKIPPIRLLTCMISASFVPNLATLPLLARLYQKTARIRQTISDPKRGTCSKSEPLCVGSTNKGSFQQLRTWFSEHFSHQNLLLSLSLVLFLLQRYKYGAKKCRKKPRSIQLLR